jgi:hypothetical protein
MSREVRVVSVGPRASERRGKSDRLAVGLRPVNTPVYSPQSNVRTFKRDYVSRMASADDRNHPIDGRQYVQYDSALVIKYGADTRWTERTITGIAVCNNTTR